MFSGAGGSASGAVTGRPPTNGFEDHDSHAKMLAYSRRAVDYEGDQCGYRIHKRGASALNAATSRKVTL